MLNESWQRFTDDSSTWDNLCERFNGNHRQLYGWGKYQAEKGWSIARYVFYSGNEIKYALQLLYKKKFFFTAIYIPGGVLGELSGYSPNLKELVKELFPRSFYYLRLDSSYDYSENHHKLFLDSGYKIPLFKMNSKDRYIINLKELTKGHFQNSSSNFRKNIKKSYKNINHIHIGFPIADDEIEATSASMQTFKKIKLRDNPKNIVNIISYLKKRIIIVTAKDENRKMLGFRCAILFNGVAYDKYAANTELGRKKLAGFAILDSIIMECKKLGAKCYLLPTSLQNEGDRKFKRSTGGSLSQSMDEYETTNLPFMMTVINLVLYFKYKL